jgi:hypothetical protein
MLIPLGFLASSGGGVDSSYELIQTYILGSSAADITFSSLATYSSSYKHLQIRYVTRSTRAAGADNLAVRLNGVTGGSYSHHRLYGDGSSVASYAGSSATYILGDSTTGNTATSGAFSAGVIDILDAYSSTKNKTVRILCGHSVSGAQAIELVSGGFYSTDSITSAQIYALTGSLAANTRMSIYGIKG